MTVKIMLACAGGMSSSILMVRMRKAAAKQHIDADVCAVGVQSVATAATHFHPDVVLIGPQVRFAAPNVQKVVNVPVAVIDMLDYGRMRGATVLQTALTLIKVAQAKVDR